MADDPAAAAAATPPAFDAAAFVASLSPENKEFATTKGYIKDEGGAITFNPNAPFDGYRNAEKLIGDKSALPSPDLSDDAKFAAWPGHKVLGVPEKPEDYKFDRPPLPNGMEWDKPGSPQWDGELEKVVRTALSKGIIGQRQANVVFNELATAQIGRMMQGFTQMGEVKQQTEQALRKDWGQGYDTNLKMGGLALNHVAEKIGVDAGQLADATSRAMGDVATAKMFAWLAKALSEDMIAGGKTEGFAEGPAAAREEIDKLKFDTEFQNAWTNETHTGHKQAVERMERLNRIAYG